MLSNTLDALEEAVIAPMKAEILVVIQKYFSSIRKRIILV